MIIIKRFVFVFFFISERIAHRGIAHQGMANFRGNRSDVRNAILENEFEKWIFEEFSIGNE
jgi:hypothetical protein